MKNKLLVSLAAIGALTVAAHGAVVLFDGSLNYDVGGNTAFATNGFPAGVTTNTVSVAYNLSTPMLSTYDDLLAGPDVYGGVYGFAENSVGVGGVPTGIYRGGESPEQIRYQSPLSGQVDTTVTVRSATLFGSTAAGTDFSAISSLAADVRLSLAPTTGSYAVHWMAVGNSGTTYVSQSTITGLGQTIATYSLADTASELWAAVTPDANMEIGTPTFNVLGSAISDITLLGLYINAGATGAGGQYTFDITKFAAVPEPSTYALLSGLLTLGLVLIRRRRT